MTPRLYTRYMPHKEITVPFEKEAQLRVDIFNVFAYKHLVVHLFFFAVSHCTYSNYPPLDFRVAYRSVTSRYATRPQHVVPWSLSPPHLTTASGYTAQAGSTMLFLSGFLGSIFKDITYNSDT